MKNIIESIIRRTALSLVLVRTQDQRTLNIGGRAVRTGEFIEDMVIIRGIQHIARRPFGAGKGGVSTKVYGKEVIHSLMVEKNSGINSFFKCAYSSGLPVTASWKR